MKITCKKDLINSKEQLVYKKNKNYKALDIGNDRIRIDFNEEFDVDFYVTIEGNFYILSTDKENYFYFYVYDYFYTKKELLNKKLKKILAN